MALKASKPLKKLTAPETGGAGVAVVTALLVIWIVLALMGFVPRGILGISALAFVLANIVVDLVYAVLDPRVRIS